MFSRFRNLFAKAKSENSPEPETETVNTQNDNVQANVGPEQTNTENYFEGNTENAANTVNAAEELGKSEVEEQVAAGEQNSAFDQKVELAQITQPNGHQSNGNVVHELSTVTLKNDSTATEDTLNACDNKNKTEESINTIENEKTVADDETSGGEVIGVADDRQADERVENNTNNGNGVEAFVSVDEQQIEVNTQSAEVIEKPHETATAAEESVNVVKAGEISAAADAANELGHVEVDVACVNENTASLISANNSDTNGVEAPTDIANGDLVQTLVEPTLNLSNLVANENYEIASSITVDELATDASSSAGDTQTQSSSPVGTVDSASTADSNTIVIKPTGNNDIACAAISHKLQEIAEVAESLDASIRDVQQDAEALEVNATNTAEKKREAMRSYSSEVS